MSHEKNATKKTTQEKTNSNQMSTSQSGEKENISLQKNSLTRDCIGYDDFLETFSSMIRQTRDKGQSRFFILAGPDAIGKSAIVAQLHSSICSDDERIMMHDMSIIQGKVHTIKVSHDETLTGTASNLYRNKLRYHAGEYRVRDYGVRECTDMIMQSSFLSYRIVWIENMQRLTPAASNAFLKTLEELPQRTIVIGTVTSSDMLMPTIASRAMIIPVPQLNASAFAEYITQSFPSVDQPIRDAIATIYTNAPGRRYQTIREYAHDESSSFFVQMQTAKQYNQEKNYLGLTKLMVQIPPSSYGRLISWMLHPSNDPTQGLDDAITTFIRRTDANVSHEHAMMILCARWIDKTEKK